MSMKLQQKGIVVTDGLTPFVTSFVTSRTLTIFSAQNGDKKKCNHARRGMEEPRQLPRLRASDKNTLRHCQAAQETQIWLPENFRFFHDENV